MPGPMEGVRVVELGMWVAGPAAAGILADWGADVVKIESPTGDPCRGFTKTFPSDIPINPFFEMDNRSKRSVVLDLTIAVDRDRALQLIDGADVFVTNVRPAVLAERGLDPATLLARNDRLVFAQVTGYGLEGPDADRQAYDIAAFWARSGLASLLTAPGGEPPFQRGAMGDHTIAMTTAGAICAALVSRARTGKGQFVSTSLLRQGAYTISFDLNMYLLWGTQLSQSVHATSGNTSTNYYRCADGRRVWIVGIEPERHWPPLCRAVGHPEWIDDERFATPRDRQVNARDLVARLDEVFATKTLDEWAEVFASEPDVFWTPLNSLEDLVADPQFRAAGGFVEVPDEVSTTTMVATPVDFHGTPAAPRSLAPKLGEHTAEVLAELHG